MENLFFTHFLSHLPGPQQDVGSGRGLSRVLRVVGGLYKPRRGRKHYFQKRQTKFCNSFSNKMKTRNGLNSIGTSTKEGLFECVESFTKFSCIEKTKNLIIFPLYVCILLFMVLGKLDISQGHLKSQGYYYSISR